VPYVQIMGYLDNRVRAINQINDQLRAKKEDGQSPKLGLSEFQATAF
jgi:hypothetical protein